MGQIEKNLTQNIDTVAMSLHSLEKIEEFVLAYAQKTGLRVTVIDLDGVVIAESDKDKELMDNHLNRDEIIQLQTADIGTVVRYSDSTKLHHLNVVRQIEVGGEWVYFRLGDYVDDIEDNFMRLSLKIVSVFFISLLLAIYLAHMVNKRLKKETDNVLEILHNLLEKKQFEVKSYSNIEEFNKITKLLNEVGGKLKNREKLKNKKNAKLKLANRQKDEIISALSHEFKNPIAVITGYCETLMKNNIDEEMKNKFLQKIENSARKMSDIIDKLRLSVKLEDGKQGLKFEPTNVKKMSESVASELVQNYKDREVVITGEEKVLEVDRVLFSIVLTNLVENALKYSKSDVKVVVENDYLEVIDTGIGLDEKELEKITQKFYRVSGNSWNNSLGLGLNIVDNIIKLHQFSLQIVSKKDVGSTFRVIFNQ